MLCSLCIMKCKLLFIIVLLCNSCSKDKELYEPEMIKPILVNIGLESPKMTLNLGKDLSIEPVFNTDVLTYKWSLNGEEFSDDRKIIFYADKAKQYNLSLHVINDMGSIEINYIINVIKFRERNNLSSPYTTSLLEYKPAPGQFINTPSLGSIEAAKNILGKPTDNIVSLGGFGGYIILGFDHTVENIPGHDIEVFANAFEGSSEAGIVMISFDYNANGKADDKWFELASSEYSSANTVANYTITYYNPHNKIDVKWSDSMGNTGLLIHNDWNPQEYYPLFIAEQESVSFTGRLLEDKTYIDAQTRKIIKPNYSWGYVDNFSDEYIDNMSNTFDIDWAVDKKGQKVVLPGVDFVKIYTATNHSDKILGESSCEIRGVADINMSTY